MACWKTRRNRIRLMEEQTNENNLLAKVGAYVSDSYQYVICKNIH